MKEEAIRYLGHEKAVFNNLTPDNCKLLLISYPQLKGSETIGALISEISRLNDMVYELKLKQQDMVASMLMARNNKLCMYAPTFEATE